MINGILPEQDIQNLVSKGHILTEKPLAEGQIQPASLDLRLGHIAYRMRASFLPGSGRSIAQSLDQVVTHKIDLSEGAVLETGCIYLVPLQEAVSYTHLTLPTTSRV